MAELRDINVALSEENISALQDIAKSMEETVTRLEKRFPPEEEKSVYPYLDGDIVVLGAECFTNGDVIAYKGENYYRACDRWVRDIPDGGMAMCVKRVNHPGNIHEDYEGNHRIDED